MPQAPKRLLIVDDDSGLQSQLRWCFADYEVEVAGDRPSALAALRAPIDRFFDEVTVNAQEENKRAHRLDLLAQFRAAVHKVADFSRIEG